MKVTSTELADYASLLRSLATADALDLSSHLTRPLLNPSQKLNRKYKRLCTRWPLLPQDVHVPEWGFEDEIQLLVSSRSDDLDDDDDEPLPPSLFEQASTHLSTILTHVSAHVPRTAESLQDRFRPLGWESILEI